MLSAVEAGWIAVRRAGSLNLDRLMEAIEAGIKAAASRGGMRTTIRFVDSEMLDFYGVPIECRADAFDRAQDELRKAGYGVRWCAESLRRDDSVGPYAVLCTRLDVTWDKDASNT